MSLPESGVMVEARLGVVGAEVMAKSWEAAGDGPSMCPNSCNSGIKADTGPAEGAMSTLQQSRAPEVGLLGNAAAMLVLTTSGARVARSQLPHSGGAGLPVMLHASRLPEALSCRPPCIRLQGRLTERPRVLPPASHPPSSSAQILVDRPGWISRSTTLRAAGRASCILASLRACRVPACFRHLAVKLASRSHTMGPSTMACTSCQGCLGPAHTVWWGAWGLRGHCMLQGCQAAGRASG